MRMLPSVLRTLVLAALLHVMGSSLFAQTRYIVTNDDVGFPLPDGVSFYAENAQGLLTFQQQVNTGGYGIGGWSETDRRVLIAPRVPR